MENLIILYCMVNLKVGFNTVSPVIMFSANSASSSWRMFTIFFIYAGCREMEARPNELFLL